MRVQWRRQLPAQLQGPRPGGWAVGSIVWPPPLWRAQAQQQPAAGSWQKLRPAPPTQARPGLHVLAWASGHHGAARARATAAAGLQGALLGHLGRPCRGRQGLEASPWGCLGLSPPGWDRLGRGQRKGGPLGRWWGRWWGKVTPGCSVGSYCSVSFVDRKGRRVLGPTGGVTRPPLSRLTFLSCPTKGLERTHLWVQCSVIHGILVLPG